MVRREEGHESGVLLDGCTSLLPGACAALPIVLQRVVYDEAGHPPHMHPTGETYPLDAGKGGYVMHGGGSPYSRREWQVRCLAW